MIYVIENDKIREIYQDKQVAEITQALDAQIVAGSISLVKSSQIANIGDDDPRTPSEIQNHWSFHRECEYNRRGATKEKIAVALVEKDLGVMTDIEDIRAIRAAVKAAIPKPS